VQIITHHINAILAVFYKKARALLYTIISAFVLQLPQQFKRSTKMEKTEQLKNLLENEILTDLENAIDEIFQILDKEKMISMSDREDLENMQEMHQECRDILVEIEAGEMTQEEASELIDELVDAKSND